VANRVLVIPGFAIVALYMGVQAKLSPLFPVRNVKRDHMTTRFHATRLISAEKIGPRQGET
jgi:hypothetical protein